MIDLTRFSRVPLAHLPTPLQPMDRLRDALGPRCPRLFVKRDDCTGLATGGNKTRKLEFLIGDALAQSCDSVVTVGAIQSNHVRQTAAAAAAFGLRCEAILFRAVEGRDPAYLRCGNLLLDRVLGARINIIDQQELEPAIDNTLLRLRSDGHNPYLVPYGGSSPEGALGYVAAFGEIASDLASKDSQASAIYHASSSGATQAGLCVGATHLGAVTRVVGVNVLKPMVEDLQAEVARIARATASLTGAEVDEVCSRIEILDGYLGEAYGVPTDAMKEALQLAAQCEGLLLDPVYSGKALAGMIGDLRKGRYRKDETVVFLHTGGAAALHAYPELF